VPELGGDDPVGHLPHLPRDSGKVADLFALLDDFTIAFEVVEPLRAR
jgi:hypothetical protein